MKALLRSSSLLRLRKAQRSHRQYGGDKNFDYQLIEILNLGDVREISVEALVIQAVADDEIIWDLKANHVDFARNF